MKEYLVWIDEAEKIVSFHEVDNSELMKMIVRRTVLAVCTLVLALILPTAASAACTGFDDVPESADCYKSEIYILRSMRLRKARGTDASPRMRRLRPVNGLSCSAAPTTSM